MVTASWFGMNVGQQDVAMILQAIDFNEALLHVSSASSGDNIGWREFKRSQNSQGVTCCVRFIRFNAGFSIWV